MSVYHNGGGNRLEWPSGQGDIYFNSLLRTLRIIPSYSGGWKMRLCQVVATWEQCNWEIERAFRTNSDVWLRDKLTVSQVSVQSMFKRLACPPAVILFCGIFLDWGSCYYYSVKSCLVLAAGWLSPLHRRSRNVSCKWMYRWRMVCRPRQWIMDLSS